MLDKIKNSLELRLNISYFVAHGFYWMFYCCTLSMASAFLTGRGYSIAAVGFLLAFIYLIATVVQQFVSDYADKSKKYSVLDILIGLTVILFISTLFLAFTRSGFGTTLWFFIVGVVLTTSMPLLNALNFSLKRAGYEMNFGVARSAGSIFFFFMSLIVGNLMNAISVNAAPACGVVVCALYLANFILLKIETNKVSLHSKVDYDPFEEQGNDTIFNLTELKRLGQKYSMFFVFLVGVVCFFFGHVIINGFFYQIVENVGGNLADNGKVLALQAIVEVPCMVFYERIRKYVSTKKCLIAAAVFFLIKIFLTTVATSVGFLCFSVLFQSISFALFIPASVHLVDEVMNEKDAVKGQAFVTMAMTISNLLASIFGGLLINFAGVKLALVFGTIVTLIGVIISIFGLVRINLKK